MLRRRWIAMVIAVALVPLGLLLKHYGPPWAAHGFTGAIYVLFFSTVAFVALPRRRHVAAIVLTVLLCTCVIECLQLIDVAPLPALRRTWLGRTLLGNQFNGIDFAWYLLGAMLSCALLWRLGRGDVSRSAGP